MNSFFFFLIFIQRIKIPKIEKDLLSYGSFDKIRKIFVKNATKLKIIAHTDSIIYPYLLVCKCNI